MLISIGLVILVVFVFLRNFSVTIIPQYLGSGFSNWRVRRDVPGRIYAGQLVAHGPGDRHRFVVDDAIVVIENITRHIENGMQPLEAALKGR